MFNNDAELVEFKKCRDSAEYFISNYCYLYNPIHGKMPFKPYPFQSFVLYNYAHARHNILRKPRQMGMSWLTAMYALWYAMFHSYKNVLIISIKEDTAKRFLHKIKFAYMLLPKFLQVKITNGNKNDYGTKTLIEFEHESRIESIPSSENAGRSEGVSLAIIDEAAFVEHMEEIWGAMYPTLSTGGEMIMLSTTNGVGNVYHKTYKEARSKINGFNAIDLTWDMHPDRDEDWYRRESRALGARKTAQEIDCEFLTSGDNVFNLSTLRNLEEELIENPFKLINLSHFQLFVKKMEMLMINSAKKSPHVKAPKQIELQNFNCGELVQFSIPSPGKRYVVGVDTAKNKATKNDNSAIVVLDYITMATVMEFCGKVNIDKLPTLVTHIGRYWNNAFLCIENTGIGLATVEGVRNLNYPIDLIYAEQETRVKKKAELYDYSKVNLGFSTNVRTKPLMIADLYDAIEDESLMIPTLRTIYELQTYITTATGDMQAANGYTDDLVMAYALAVQGRKAWRPRGELVLNLT